MFEKTNDKISKGTALITGGSSGIGAIYADRLAKRGYELILVARRRERLNSLAKRISNDTGRSVEVIVADLTDKADQARIEHVLHTDARITLLVNNAGVIAPTPLLSSDIDTLDRMIELNVTAVVRLTCAILPAFVKRGGGAIINLSSVTAIMPEVLNGVYDGTKAFVLAFSLAVHKEFAKSNIRVQAVLPGLTTTDLWNTAGTPLDQKPSEMLMKPDDVVDAALAGFDQGELVTIPSLPDIADWEAYEAARQNLFPKLSLNSPATRYALAAVNSIGKQMKV
jgi:hypothetical protein